MNMDDFLDFLITILIFLCGIAFGIFLSSISFEKYDVNQDGQVNSQDYVLIKNYIMENN